jgi:hypothetical protein
MQIDRDMVISVKQAEQAVSRSKYENVRIACRRLLNDPKGRPVVFTRPGSGDWLDKTYLAPQVWQLHLRKD